METPEVKGTFTMGSLRTETYRVLHQADLVGDISMIVGRVADQSFEWETPEGDVLDYDSEDIDEDYAANGSGFTLRNALASLVTQAIAYGRAQGYDGGYGVGFGNGLEGAANDDESVQRDSATWAGNMDAEYARGYDDGRREGVAELQ